VKFNTLSILVVDDSQFTSSLVVEIFRRWDAKVVYMASDGEAALRELANRALDLVIMDWNMGATNGLDLVRKLRGSAANRNRSVPVVMLTGHAEKHRVIEARDAGVNGFLVKPFAPKTLLRRVQQVLEDPDRMSRATFDEITEGA